MIVTKFLGTYKMPVRAQFSKYIKVLALTAVLTVPLAGCATSAHNTYDEDAGVSDPIQPFNRAMLSFNEILDKVLFNPVVAIYRTVVPEVARKAVHNVLDNVKAPVYLANELLQGDLEGAGTVVKRFAINTTVGVAGLVDVAAKNGTTYQPEDFGQTLAVWGVGPGPYIVWPILGPSTLRDTFGFAGDIAMDPLFWYAYNNEKYALQYGRTGLTLLDTKDRYHDMMEDLRRNSGDLYTSLQSVYMQRRKALINDLDPKKTALPSIE